MRRRASISNIAWPSQDDGEALDLAAKLGFSGVELAPGKVFRPVERADTAAFGRYRREVEARGMEIVALQAILFDVHDAHLFTDARLRRRLAERLAAVAAMAAELGAGACVFGSPSLRDPGDRSPQEAHSIATDFFRAIAPRFAAFGTVLAFEANPAIYNCRFVTHTREAVALVEDVGTEGFGLQLDLGTVFANAEDTQDVEIAGRIAAHCHVSEPSLAPVGRQERDHAPLGQALAASGYQGWVSVEMLATDDWRNAMKRAARVIEENYS